MIYNHAYRVQSGNSGSFFLWKLRLALNSHKALGHRWEEVNKVHDPSNENENAITAQNLEKS